MKKYPTLQRLTAIPIALSLLSCPALATVWTDSDIEQAVKRRVAWELAPGNGLNVVCKDGMVTLRGHVTNLLQKQRAERIAGSRKGVRSVINQVIIDAGPIEDAQITASANEALSDEPVFASQNINASTAGGVVTLSGSVDHIDLKRLVEHTVAPIIGVRGINNALTIDQGDVTRADDEIKSHIERRFRADVWLNDFFIEVSVDQGHVILSGTAGTVEQLRRAVGKAMVPGVHSVASDKVVIDARFKDTSRRAEERPKLSDSEMVDAIKDALMHHGWIVGSDIDVTVSDRVATLRGQVSSLRIKTAARRTAQNTVGIARVNDFITVGSTEITISDDLIQNRVQRNLKRNFYTARYPIAVEVDQGTVTLTGQVETPFERNQATIAASTTYGVRDVATEIETNRLLRGYRSSDLDTLTDTQQPSPAQALPIPDAQIKEDVESELFWSWWVDSDAITVQVADGEVTLSGTVDSPRELRVAVANAFDGGARTVVNNLSITQ